MGGRGGSSGMLGSGITLIDDRRPHTVNFDGGYVEYIVYHENGGDTIYVNELHTDQDRRGQGIGTKIVNEMKATADKNNMPLELLAAPFDRSSMGTSELVKWYENRGFTHVGSNRMVYRPRRR